MLASDLATKINKGMSERDGKHSRKRKKKKSDIKHIHRDLKNGPNTRIHSDKEMGNTGQTSSNSAGPSLACSTREWIRSV